MPVSWLSPFIIVRKQIYRLLIVPIHCDDYKATDLQWHFEGENKPTFLCDSMLPFGSNKGPSHFHRLSQAIRRCMLRKSFRGIVAYIDDFFIAAATYEECRKWMDILMKLKKARIFDQLGKGGGAEPTHHLPGCRHRHNKQHPVLVGQIYIYYIYDHGFT